MSEAHRPEPSPTLTAALVAAEHERLAGRVAAADAAAGPEPWNALQADWNALKVRVYGEGSRRRHRFSQDTRDAEAEAAEAEFREKILPAAQAGDSALVAALLASRHREAVAERHGRQLLRVLEVGQETLAPVNSDLRVETSGIARDYDKLLAGAEVTVGGEAMTLSRARGRLGSPDAELRREAFEAWSGWFVQRRDELAALFGSLVERRDLMGRNLGHENFVPLGYAGMLRTDYGPAEAAAFREAVLKNASPLHEALCREQAAALGTEALRPWDRGFHPGFTLPTGAAEPVSEQLDKAGRVFARLSPRLAAHFERMRAEGLIDLENRPGKAAGAYCTSFADTGQVAIFCNSIGDEGDVKTLMHEMGHAFQGWESLWIESVDLRSPSLDACEVHSMGMEFLSLPHLDEFFSPEDCERFARGRWARAIQLLCYVSVVDAFQHWIYENPQASPDARDACWVELQDRFMPGIDWSGEAERHRAARWYAQPHVFRRPFYYLDYAIAETGAMQLALLDAQDHEACLETYLELCRLGGTRSVLELFDGAGLRSPFEPAVLADLMRHAAQVLHAP